MPAKLDLSMGKLMLAEIQEFGTFRLEVQRYICRSLDIAFCPDARSADWARNEDEAERVKCAGRGLPRSSGHPPLRPFS